MLLLTCPAGVSPSAFQSVAGWDFSRVRLRIAHDQGLPMSFIERIEHEWKKYVLLLIANPGVKFPMADSVDRFAHEHISDTRNFREFCKAIGKIIHHQPTVNEEEKVALLPDYHRLTLPTMKNLFGVVDEDIWVRDRCVCTYDIEI